MADPVKAARRYDYAFNAQDADARFANLPPDTQVTLPGGTSLSGPEPVIAIAQLLGGAARRADQLRA